MEKVKSEIDKLIFDAGKQLCRADWGIQPSNWLDFDSRPLQISLIIRPKYDHAHDRRDQNWHEIGARAWLGCQCCQVGLFAA